MRRLLVLVCALLAACSPPANAPRNPPTLPAPGFVEAQQAVTLGNVANIRYLGRLDQPNALSSIISYAVSPDATRLVAINNDALLAWNLVDGSLLFQTSRGGVTRVFYSSDKTEIYGLDGNGQASVFDTNSGAVRATFRGHLSFNRTTAYFADAGWLALGGSDGTVKVWDSYARQSLVTLDAHGAALTALAFSSDGETLATAGEDGLVRLWRWRDRALLAETKLDPATAIRQLAVAPDGSYVAIGTNLDARLWAQNGTEQVYVLDTGRGGAIQILRFSPDGRTLLAGNQSAGLSLWNLVSGTLAARLPDTQGNTIAASFSPDGSLLLTAVLNGKVSLWNLEQISGNTVNQAALNVGTQQVLDVEWTSDSRLLMFFDAVGPVYLWGIGGNS